MIAGLSLSSAVALPDTGLRAPQGPAAQAGTESFTSMLGRVAEENAATLRQGEAAALGAIQGSVPLQTVVDKVMAAERTLQATLAVRDKLVSGYLEISRMQI